MINTMHRMKMIINLLQKDTINFCISSVWLSNLSKPNPARILPAKEEIRLVRKLRAIRNIGRELMKLKIGALKESPIAVINNVRKKIINGKWPFAREVRFLDTIIYKIN